MDYQFQPRGVCSREIHFSIDESGVITACRFVGGCSGNTQGVSALVTGMKAEEAIAKLEGIRCGARPSSCPDQLSRALKAALQESKNL